MSLILFTVLISVLPAVYQTIECPDDMEQIPHANSGSCYGLVPVELGPFTFWHASRVCYFGR